MDSRVLYFILGRLALFLSMILLIPLAVSLIMQDGEGAVFTETICVTGACSLLFARAAGGRPEAISTREGYAITGIGWLLTTALGMLPYFFGGHLGFLDGIFESISGFSGGGATVVRSIESLPPSILLWRSMTHWFGGLGIIVIFIALLPQTGQSAVNMYNAEASGPSRDRVLPQIRSMAFALFEIYVFFTALACVVYLLCGMEFLPAIDHAMATIGAGGFSTYDTSAMNFHHPVLEGAMTFFMVLVGGNFALYYRAYKKGARELLRNSEFAAYLSFLLAAMVLVSWNLSVTLGYAPSEAFRYASFQVASLSTTGFVSADYEMWPAFSKGVLLLLMLCGGCAGSTAGGMKMARVLVLLKNARAVILQKLHPNLVQEVRMNGEIVSAEMIQRVGQFFVVYLMFVLLWTLLFTADGLQFFESFAIAITTMGTVGPAFGIAGATGNYAGLSAFSKIVCCISMLLGRLEIFTLLVLLRADFWRGKGRW